MTDAEKLADAQSQLHKLQTGTSAVRVQKGDMEVQYSRANEADLRTYISELKVATGGTASRGRPFGFSL